MGLRSWIESRRLVFIHHNAGPNLGDKLCTPRRYFHFAPMKGVGRIAIIGGGAWRGFGLDAAPKISAKHKILWGVGVSLHADRPTSEISLDRLSELYDFRSTRDPDWAGDSMKLVPCPSVFHPICETPLGTEDGVFLNGGKPSGDNASRFLQQMGDRGVVVGTNYMDLQTFTDAFAKTRRIVTNSYHTAYWGLLSGREIGVVGYSSKFASLVRLFNLPTEFVSMYRKGADPTDLLKPTTRTPWLRVHDPLSYREGFQQMNCDFAQELVRQRLFSEITLIR